MHRVNYSILANKEIQKYLLESGYDKYTSLTNIGFYPFFIINEDDVILCGSKSKSDNYDLMLYSKNSGIYKLNDIKKSYRIYYQDNDKLLRIGKLNEFYKSEKIQDLYLIGIQELNGKLKLCVFKNENIIFEIEDIIGLENNNNGNFKYSKQENNKVEVYNKNLIDIINGVSK